MIHREIYQDSDLEIDDHGAGELIFRFCITSLVILILIFAGICYWLS